MLVCQNGIIKSAVLVRVKLVREFSQFSNSLYPIQPQTKYQPITTNLTINTTITTPTHLAIISTHYTSTTPTTLKPSNLPYNKTLNINNTIIPLHHKKLLNTKIEPCRTMLYYKTTNSLSERLLYSVNIYINKYNITALYQRIKPRKQ